MLGDLDYLDPTLVKTLVKIIIAMVCKNIRTVGKLTTDLKYRNVVAQSGMLHC